MGIGKIFRGGKEREQPIGAEYSGEQELPKKKRKKKKNVIEKDPMKNLKRKG